MKAAMTIAHYCNDSASTEWLAEMRAMETEGERTPAQLTYNGQPLVRIADTWVTPETAAEFFAEVAA